MWPFSLVTPRKGIPTRTNTTVSALIQLAEANQNRKSILFQNQGAVTVFLGGPAVAISGANRGYALFAGATFVDNATDTEWWAIPASGSPIVHVEEVF